MQWNAGSSATPFPSTARVMAQLFRAPNDTARVFELIDAIARSRPKRVAVVVRQLYANPILKKQFDEKYIPEFPSTEEISQYSANSLAANYWRFIRANQLSDLPHPEMQVDDPFSYFRLRIYTVHDLWHVLLDLNTTVQDELALQAFGYAQLGSPVSLILVLMGLSHFLIKNPRKFPALALKALRFYRLGRRAEPLLEIRVEDFLKKPLRLAREELEIKF